jgi:hypothetical protein
MKLTMHESEKLPEGHPLRVVWTAEKGGQIYRIARDENDGNKWRLDRRTIFGWEAPAGEVYESRAAAVRALASL